MATSSIGSDIISSLGIGVYNPKSIAEALANAETIGRKSTIEENQTKLTNKLTAYNTIKSAMEGLKVGLGDLAKASSFSQKSLTSSDSTAVSASVNSTVSAGTYEVQVINRAKAHTMATQSFASQMTTIGEGTLTLSVGGSSQDIDIGAGNNTLSAIKESINNAKMGISASVVNDGSGYRLLLTAQNSGAANVISMSVTDDDGGDSDNAGLSALVSGVTSPSVAQNASFKVNGLTLSSSSNQISGAIDGVTLNLNKENTTSTISVVADTSTVKDSVKSVIEDYNAMKSIMDNYTTYAKDEKDPTKGILAGDSTISQLRFQMRSMLNFKSSDSSSPVQSMADIGVKTQLDGSLVLDEATLNSVLSESPEGVAKLFASVAEPSSSLVRFKNATDRTNADTFDVSITQVAQQGSYTGTGSAGTATDPVAIASTNNTFKLKLNGVESNVLTVGAGSYTKSSMATYLQGLINNDSNLKAKDAKISVSYNDTTNAFDFLTDKYGSVAKIEFTDVGSDLAVQLGLEVKTGTAGKDVAGTLTGSTINPDTSLPYGYVFLGTGQQVKINSYLSGSPKDLEFDVLGNADGSTLTVTKGYASGLSSKIDTMLDSKIGLIGNKITNVTKSNTLLGDQLTKVQEKYDALVQKYVYQFGMVNALQSQMTALSDSLTAMFSNSSDN